MRFNNASDEAVKKATGKDWAAWRKALDKLGAHEMNHPDIARALFERKMITSRWWCQMVTNSYEKMIGRRALGERSDKTYAVGARKTVAMSAAEAWKRLTSPAGYRLWLGAVPKDIRSSQAPRRLRVRWARKGWKKPTTVQLSITPTGTKKCAVMFDQSDLPTAAARVAMKKHWRAVLEKIPGLA